jgi:hypothetical protein
LSGIVHRVGVIAACAAVSPLMSLPNISAHRSGRAILVAVTTWSRVLGAIALFASMTNRLGL